jgi:hypothetical protein
MAKNDIKIYDTGGLNSVPVYKFQTEAAATAIYAGEPVKLKAAGSPYVIPWSDGDITPGTDTNFIGLAASDSTQTASADGYVMVYPMLPNMVFEAKAKTAANVDTQSEIDALCGDRKIIDLTSSTYTVDDGAADAAANALFIVGGDPVKKTLRFMVRPYVNVVDNA